MRITGIRNLAQTQHGSVPDMHKKSKRPCFARARRRVAPAPRSTTAGMVKRFLAAYGPIAQHFRPRRHLLSASTYCDEMRQRFESWADITGTERAA